MKNYSVLLLVLLGQLLSSIEEESNNIHNPEEDAKLDQELSYQLKEAQLGNDNEWTAWSSWSPCSRSCGGGVSQQLRRCRLSSCRGDRIRYKICNIQSLVVLFVALAAANAGVIAPAASVLQGPSARATVAGPDGSVISSAAPGGTVVSETAPGYAAYAAPAVAAPAVVAAAPAAYAAYAAPAPAVVAAPAAYAAYAAPAPAAYAAPAPVAAYAAAPAPVAYAAPAAPVAYAAPAAPVAYAAAPYAAYAGVREDAVIAGPSGTVTSSKVAF